MATVNKDFKIKSGLIVEGTTATVNGYDILTKKQADQDYIVNLIGGTATSQNTPDTVVKRDGSGNFAAGEITADLIGDVTGQVSDISNHNTDDLSEGSTNKYFTNQRALDATSAAYDPAGSATNAYNDAVATAQDYTDAEIADEVIARDAAIGVSLTSANNYADTVSGNALTSANSYTDDEISTEITNRNNAIASAKQEAIDEASSDATSKANTAESNANSYTDDEISALEGRSQTYADTAATTAENNAKAYADGLSSGLNWKQAVHLLYDAAIPVLSGSGATQLIIDGHAPLGDADSGYRVLITQSSNAGIYVYNSTGGSWTLTRSEDADAFAELVGAAVFVMEGTNYGSTAWVQAEHYLSSFSGQSWTQFSGQGTYLAGNGINLDGTTFSIDTAITATKSYADGVATDAEDAAKAYTDIRETAITTAYENYANGVETSANNYTDGKIATEVSDRDDAIDSAISTEVTNRNNAIATAKSEAITDANNHADGLIADEIVDRNNAIDNAINALSTSDIEEGSNLYFEDGRAKSSAADLLTSANLTNIIITGSGAGLTITAENGVADSNTDQLAEGTTNKYFTDARVLDATSNATSVEVQKLDISWVRREEAAYASIATASTATVHSFGTNEGSVKYLVRVYNNNKSHVTEVLATTDSDNNVAVVEYGTIYTSENPLATVTVAWNSSTSQYDLNVTTANNNSEVLVAATLLAYND
jgi:hypothetical protein